MPNIEDFVGRLCVDDVPELLNRAWEAATSEQQRAFVTEHLADIRDMVSDEEGV